MPTRRYGDRRIRGGTRLEPPFGPDRSAARTARLGAGPAGNCLSVPDFDAIEETHLPGMGVRYDFISEQGNRLGVVVLDSGERELLICDESDPDSARTLRLTGRDLARLREILGISVGDADS